MYSCIKRWFTQYWKPTRRDFSFQCRESKLRSDSSHTSSSPEPELPRVSGLLRQRDLAAFGVALERFRPLLKALLLEANDPRLNSKVDSSDIIQQTFKDAIKGFDQLRADNSTQFFAWLRTLLFHNLGRVRRHYVTTRKRSVKFEKSMTGNSTIIQLVPDPKRNPEADAISDELLQRLANEVACLPQPIQILLKWRFEDGLTFKQISERVDRSENAVRMLLVRCIKSLKSNVVGEESGEFSSGLP